ncbi:MAG: serine hydrolase [Bacteroidetes bacterium]|nr:serine hydrolase [Bacteroidota bacterium]
MRNHLLLFTLLFSASCLWAQDINTAKLDSLFTLLESNDKSMGSIAIFQDGKPVYQRAIGYADAEADIKANPETKYRIGSISKTFTAVIIFQLIEEGWIELDTKLSTFFPKVAGANKITIEQLLGHRSGLFNLTNVKDFPEWMYTYQSKEKMLERVQNLKLDFKPGEKAEYSNTNYLLLTWIAEKLTEQDYPDILRERIVNPLDLKHTKYGDRIAPQNNEAQSYDYLDTWEVLPQSNMSIPQGAGGIISTPSDINRFLFALFAGELIKMENVEKMKTPKDKFGLGLFMFPFYGKAGFGHNGGIDGFQSAAAYFPEEKLNVAYLANGVVYPNNDILIGVLSICFDRDYEFPEFKETISLSAKALEKFTGVYASPDFPMDVTVKLDGETLTAQATGQPSFPLESIGETEFQFLPAGIEMEFFPDKDEMVLRQGGMEFILKRN